MTIWPVIKSRSFRVCQSKGIMKLIIKWTIWSSTDLAVFAVYPRFAAGRLAFARWLRKYQETEQLLRQGFCDKIQPTYQITVESVLNTTIYYSHYNVSLWFICYCCFVNGPFVLFMRTILGELMNSHITYCF